MYTNIYTYKYVRNIRIWYVVYACECVSVFLCICVCVSVSISVIYAHCSKYNNSKVLPQWILKASTNKQ